MASAARTQAACEASAFSDAHLLWANFDRRTMPFRQRYDAHVRVWQHAVKEATVDRHFRDDRFACAYEDRLDDQRIAHFEWLAAHPLGGAK